MPLAISGARLVGPEEDKWELIPYEKGNYITICKKKRDLKFFAQNDKDIVDGNRF